VVYFAIQQKSRQKKDWIIEKRMRGHCIQLIISIVILSLFSACGKHSDSTISSPSPQPVKYSAGQELFLNHCMGCHMGPGDPPGPNDVILDSSKLASKNEFKAYLRNPDNGSMPPFSADTLSDADVETLYTYFKTLRP
jgi:mono/diheme cytochrome c family protein